MKTNNVILRPMGEFKVAQRTKDGMFNATALLKQWNEKSISERKMANFFASEKTNEFVQTIMAKEDLHTPKMVYVKSRASRGDSAGTWMHPMLFIDFAMWINPSFKYDVLKFVYDQMIKYRNDAGDAYKKLANSVQKIVSASFMPVAMSNLSKAINHVVFGSHETMMRNKIGEESKQQELFALEAKLSDLIEDGFITSYDNLMNYLRRKWCEKYTPALLKQ